METLEEFKKQTKKVSQQRVHTIKNSYGVKEYYANYRKTRPREKKYVLTCAQFYTIIRRVNQKLADLIALGHNIILPKYMGEIEVLQNDGNLKLKDGKVINKRHIDWNKTLELWFEDQQAKEKKQTVKFESHTNYKISYKKTNAKYKNNWFVVFLPNRELKLHTGYNIKNGILTDTFIYKNERTAGFN